MSFDLRHTPRLHTEFDLRKDQAVNLVPEQAHYLKNVMRLAPGDSLRLFNGRDGEWRGEIAGSSGKASKQTVAITIIEQLKPQSTEPDLWLCCAPIKKAHFDYMIEKAAELGASAIRPILTARTQIREVNTERCRAIAVKAAEQSERLSVPVIEKPAPITQLAVSWPDDRTLIVCAEWGDAAPVREAFASPKLKAASSAAIVTGPEGGFTAEELDMLRRIKNAVFIRLGPRILRADTAAIAALSCWQALRGDWQCDKSQSSS